MSNTLRTRLLRHMALIALFCINCRPGEARADDSPPRAQNGDPFVVRDVGVYLLSAYGTKLNDRNLFQSTLPSYMLSRRPVATREEFNEPTPAGILTITGPAEEDVDVLLEFDVGRFLSHWPPGRLRSKRLLWAGIDVAEKSTIDPASMPEDHWLLPLRQAERLYFVGKKQADRFLLYDAELPYAPHVTLARSKGGYTVTNTGKFPIHDVAVYRPVEEGLWEVAAASRVDAAGKPTDDEDAGETAAEVKSPPAAEGKAATDKPQAVPAGAVAAPPQATAVKAPAKPVAGTHPGEATPADGRKGESEKNTKPPAGVSAPASIVGQMSAEDALEAWRASLEEMGLESAEINFVLGILRRQALRSDGAMLVYRLDEAQLEKMLPLEVTPYPDRVFRVALVVVQDADPDLQSQVESLVAQLGDDEWKKREAAQRQLSELGLAAKPKLEAALNDKDAEIVFRAEQLLEALKSAP